MRAVCQTHRLKYFDKWGTHSQQVQHSMVLQTDLPEQVVTCGQSYPVFYFFTVDFDLLLFRTE